MADRTLTIAQRTNVPSTLRFGWAKEIVMVSSCIASFPLSERLPTNAKYCIAVANLEKLFRQNISQLGKDIPLLKLKEVIVPTAELSHSSFATTLGYSAAEFDDLLKYHKIQQSQNYNEEKKRMIFEAFICERATILTAVLSLVHQEVYFPSAIHAPKAYPVFVDSGLCDASTLIKSCSTFVSGHSDGFNKRAPVSSASAQIMQERLDVSFFDDAFLMLSAIMHICVVSGHFCIEDYVEMTKALQAISGIKNRNIENVPGLDRLRFHMSLFMQCWSSEGWVLKSVAYRYQTASKTLQQERTGARLDALNSAIERAHQYFAPIQDSLEFVLSDVCNQREPKVSPAIQSCLHLFLTRCLSNNPFAAFQEILIKRLMNSSLRNHSQNVNQLYSCRPVRVLIENIYRMLPAKLSASLPILSYFTYAQRSAVDIAIAIAKNTKVTVLESELRQISIVGEDIKYQADGFVIFSSSGLSKIERFMGAYGISIDPQSGANVFTITGEECFYEFDVDVQKTEATTEFRFSGWQLLYKKAINLCRSPNHLDADQCLELAELISFLRLLIQTFSEVHQGNVSNGLYTLFTHQTLDESRIPERSFYIRLVDGLVHVIHQSMKYLSENHQSTSLRTNMSILLQEALQFSLLVSRAEGDLQLNPRSIFANTLTLHGNMEKMLRGIYSTENLQRSYELTLGFFKLFEEMSDYIDYTLEYSSLLEFFTINILFSIETSSCPNETGTILLEKATKHCTRLFRQALIHHINHKQRKWDLEEGNIMSQVARSLYERQVSQNAVALLMKACTEHESLSYCTSHFPEWLSRRASQVSCLLSIMQITSVFVNFAYFFRAEDLFKSFFQKQINTTTDIILRKVVSSGIAHKHDDRFASVTADVITSFHYLHTDLRPKKNIFVLEFCKDPEAFMDLCLDTTTDIYSAETHNSAIQLYRAVSTVKSHFTSTLEKQGILKNIANLIPHILAKSSSRPGMDYYDSQLLVCSLDALASNSDPTALQQLDGNLGGIISSVIDYLYRSFKMKSTQAITQDRAQPFGNMLSVYDPDGFLVMVSIFKLFIKCKSVSVRRCLDKPELSEMIPFIIQHLVSEVLTLRYKSVRDWSPAVSKAELNFSSLAAQESLIRFRVHNFSIFCDELVSFIKGIHPEHPNLIVKCLHSCFVDPRDNGGDSGHSPSAIVYGSIVDIFSSLINRVFKNASVRTSYLNQNLMSLSRWLLHHFSSIMPSEGINRKCKTALIEACLLVFETTERGSGSIAKESDWLHAVIEALPSSDNFELMINLFNSISDDIRAEDLETIPLEKRKLAHHITKYITHFLKQKDYGRSLDGLRSLMKLFDNKFFQNYDRWGDVLLSLQDEASSLLWNELQQEKFPQRDVYDQWKMILTFVLRFLVTRLDSPHDVLKVASFISGHLPHLAWGLQLIVKRSAEADNENSATEYRRLNLADLEVAKTTVQILVVLSRKLRNESFFVEVCQTLVPLAISVLNPLIVWLDLDFMELSFITATEREKKIDTPLRLFSGQRPRNASICEAEINLIRQELLKIHQGIELTVVSLLDILAGSNIWHLANTVQLTSIDRYHPLYRILMLSMNALRHFLQSRSRANDGTTISPHITIAVQLSVCVIQQTVQHIVKEYPESNYLRQDAEHYLQSQTIFEEIGDAAPEIRQSMKEICALFNAPFKLENSATNISLY